MKRKILFGLIIGLLSFYPTLPASEKNLPEEVDQQMADDLSALDEIDKQITSIQSKLKQPQSTQDKKKLKEELSQLEVEQKKILERLELRLFGPRPTTIQDEPKANLEKQLEKQRQRHESILESNVEQRLPTN